MRCHPITMSPVVILMADILIVGEAGVQGGRGPGEDRRVELGRVGLVGGRGRLVITDGGLNMVSVMSSQCQGVGSLPVILWRAARWTLVLTVVTVLGAWIRLRCIWRPHVRAPESLADQGWS